MQVQKRYKRSNETKYRQEGQKKERQSNIEDRKE